MVEESLFSSEAAYCSKERSCLPVITSVASLIGYFYVVGTYWRILAVRQHPAGIMFGMSLYGAIYQFLFLLDRTVSSVKCTDIGILVDFFHTGQETYMLIFAIDLLLALKNPFSASKGQMTKYHICGGLWSFLCAMISHFDSTQYALFSFCWFNSGADSLQRTSIRIEKNSHTTLTAGVFFAVYMVVVYCTSLLAIVRTWNTFVKGLPDTFRTRQRIQRHLKYYVGCYFGYWTVVLVCYAVLRLLPYSSFEIKGGLKCCVWHLLSCLLLAKGMVHALIWTRTSNILALFEQFRQTGTIILPVPNNGNWDDNINWALRLEILTSTSKGICQSVDRAEDQARASTDSSSRSLSDASLEEGKRGPALNDDYCDRKESYTQIEELLLETHDNHSRNEGVVFKDFAPHVFRCLREVAKVSSASYRNSLQQTTKEQVSEGKSGAFFYFTQDRKYVVKTLANEELKFFLSILPTYYTYMKRHPDTFMTRFFGCHGLTMYGKTVFFVVMQSVFATSLPIHERFDLKGSWVGRLEGRKPLGTVATCKFCNAEYTIRTYEQRCHGRGERHLNHQYDQVGKDLNWNRHMALPFETAQAVAMQLTADSEFLCSINCIDYSLLVGIHHRNVSHYSSVERYGVPLSNHSNHYPMSSRSSRSHSNESYGNHCTIRNRSNSHNSDTDLLSCSNYEKTHSLPRGMSVDEVHGPGLYYLGLIDILQPWNVRKRVEHFIRVSVLLQDRHGISVVSPRQYADRFQQRVVKELIYDPAVLPLQSDSASFTQLQVQNRRNAHLIESNRTLSTMLASFDGPVTSVDSVGNLRLSPQVRTISYVRTPPPVRRIQAPFATTQFGEQAAIPAHSWDIATCSRFERRSNGFVMAIPGSISMVYPTALNSVRTAPECVKSLHHRTASRRWSHRSSHRSYSVVHFDASALRSPSSPIDYRIVRTPPTCPTKIRANAPTLSA
ncbi:hypothetical protein CCR75_003829 [Bremia lactucae]|uniref:PIPK domain-containing protein n=1 Tax=Bremia lactucae TaxID=4779 RepID=A0A976ILH6_BRELC|nr:hypothetical protein CCR75_003829 [Bremia lactucae]